MAGLAALATLWSCNDDSLDAVITVDSNFESATDGWISSFSGYSTSADSTYMDTLASRTRLPRGLDTTRYAYRIFSWNAKESMFNYLKKKVTGLKANSTYELVLDVDFGSNYADNASAETPVRDVTLKAGASPDEPVTKLTNKVYTFNLDKGTGPEAGKDVVWTGSVASGRTDTRYAIVRHSNAGSPFKITTNNAGELWFFVGTDSNFRDTTVFYYDRIIATIKEQ